MKKIKTNAANTNTQKKRARRGRNFQFTDNKNNPDLVYEALKEDYKIAIRYIEVGYETAPKTGHKHRQGWIQMNVEKTISQMKKLLPQGCHIEHLKASEVVNDIYCAKDNKSISMGYWIKQGQRTDLERVYKALREGCTMTYVLTNWPNLFTRYYKAFERARKLFIKEQAIVSLKKQMSQAILRSWQTQALDRLDNQNNRQILWIVDREGNKGKTFLSKYLVGMKNAYWIRGGRNQDIAFGYDYEDIICFDFAREQEERINYQIVESFKDGMLFSSKYESELKIFTPKLVICLSNFWPDETKLSADRWDIIELPQSV